MANTRTLKDEEIYIENSSTVRSVIRKRILIDNLIEYKCGECNSLPEWRGYPMSLVLDHVNGINNDHRLSNLRWLCPNCNHQQPTYAGKNKKKAADTLCVDCDTKVHRQSTRCNSCSSLKKHKDGLMSYSKHKD